MEERTEPVLEAKGLWVSFASDLGTSWAVRGASFHVRRGETLAMVGESGSGKTVAARSAVRLLPKSGRISDGEVRLEGKDVLSLPEGELRALRRTKVGMLFQEPSSSLDPTMKVGRQIGEALSKERGMSRAEVRRRSIELLELVGMPDAARRADQYPHQFSGGMCQRVVIAIALACSPTLLVADEPTTALDVTIQAEIIELLQQLQKRLGMSILLITHDLGIVARIAHRIAIMYAGKVLETGTRRQIFYEPKHPYTRGLLESVPHVSEGDVESLVPIAGAPPDASRPPAGCPFTARCREALRICPHEMPANVEFDEGHSAACWLHAGHAAAAEAGRGV